MLRTFTIIILVALVSPWALAQQRQQSTFDHVNGFNLNGAYAGLDSCIHAFAQQKLQWIGVDRAPRNTQVQAHMPLRSNMGVGFEFDVWSAGFLRSISLSGTFAKHVKLTDNINLGAAVSLGYNNFRFDPSDVVAFESDFLMTQSQVNGGGVFADLGILVHHEQWEAGISIPRILSTGVDLDIDGGTRTFDPERYFNLHGAYDYQLNDAFELTPMVIYRAIPGQGAMFDMKAGARYMDMIGLNLGYRTRSGLLVALDFLLNDRIQFGYAYDAGFSRLSGVSGGSHEFLLGFQMCRPPREKTPEPVDYYLNGKVSEADNSAPLVGTQVLLKNLTDGTVDTLMTDSNGNYVAMIDTNARYQVTALSPDHEPLAKSLTPSPENTTSNMDFSIPRKKINLGGRVVDASTGTPLSGVKVTLKSKDATHEMTTDADGKFSMVAADLKKNEAAAYEVQLSKEGYEPMAKNFNLNPKDYMTIQLDGPVNGALGMTKEKKPEKIAEIIDLNPINFAVNSAAISPEAATELDKVVKLLNERKEMNIEIGSHTDCTGKADGNMRLSQKRAESTLAYIQSRISNPERISGKGYGETQPSEACECGACSKEQHAKNRRTEFRIVE